MQNASNVYIYDGSIKTTCEVFEAKDRAQHGPLYSVWQCSCRKKMPKGISDLLILLSTKCMKESWGNWNKCQWRKAIILKQLVKLAWRRGWGLKTWFWLYDTNELPLGHHTHVKNLNIWETLQYLFLWRCWWGLNPCPASENYNYSILYVHSPWVRSKPKQVVGDVTKKWNCQTHIKLKLWITGDWKCLRDSVCMSLIIVCRVSGRGWEWSCWPSLFCSKLCIMKLTS